eukprot:Rhum_TRINITY_DN14838_c0_g1::Rhum_TRINITY_DN14838_c0_g1_i2::g.122208::m.122208
MKTASLLLAAASAASAAQPHNLLFMMADQMRYDTIGPNGAGTPNIDKLAAEGLSFDKHYTSTPTCTPARAAILTGQKPWNHGMIGYGEVAERYPHEMARELDGAGYITRTVGKDHFGYYGKSPFAHGYGNTNLYEGVLSDPDNYTRWLEAEKPGKTPSDGWPTLDMNSWRGAPYAFEEKYHPTAWTGRQAVELLTGLNAAQKSGNDTRPFFVKVSFHRPHSPYDPPARLLDQVKASDLPPIRVATDGWDTFFKGRGCGPQYKDAWCGDMPVNESTLARRAYYANIRFVDEWVGSILDVVDKTNTLIMWTADHGDGQGDHFHWRKGYPYELSSHIPLVLRWPDTFETPVKRGSRSSALTELRDVMPTMLDGGGVEVPDTVDGMSLLCLLQPARANCGGRAWRTLLDLEHSTCYNASNHWNALTDGSVKYIFNANFPAEGGAFPQEQLFNVTADPYELVDLASKPAYRATLALFRQRMVRQFEDEKRGPVWVQNGQLMRRTKGQLYSPNYPGLPPEEDFQLVQ